MLGSVSPQIGSSANSYSGSVDPPKKEIPSTYYQLTATTGRLESSICSLYERLSPVMTEGKPEEAVGISKGGVSSELGRQFQDIEIRLRNYEIRINEILDRLAI